MEIDETTGLFKKLLNFGVLFLVFTVLVIVLNVVMSMVSAIVGGNSWYMPGVIGLAVLGNVQYLGLSIGHLVLSSIGNKKGINNRILSFVFGIVTLVIAAILAASRVSMLINQVRYMLFNISLLSLNAGYIGVMVLNACLLAIAALVIVFAILAIMISVKIIKANNPSVSRQQAAPPGYAYAGPGTIGAPSLENKDRFCPQCGAPNNNNALYCAKCGSRL
jgi:hypothetical protein